MSKETLTLSILALSLILVCHPAKSEGSCPLGYYPQVGQGVHACIQIPVIGGEQQPSGPRWADRWGAIAFGETETSGIPGVSANKRNKREAERAALTDCIKSGGRGCEVSLTYYNQCAVIAWGNNGARTASAATIDEASAIALEECSKRTSGCRIFYSECSYPERIQ